MSSAEPGKQPMPGEELGGGIVVASVIYSEDDAGECDWTVIVLNPQPPYYTVGTGHWHDDGFFEWGWSQDHHNIVPAVNGDVHPERWGYKDMGGDY